MKPVQFSYLLTIGFIAVFTLGLAYSEDERILSNSSDRESSRATDPFEKMMAVLTHQRCVNCHPSGDKPRKGDDPQVTRALGVPRGDDGHGLKGNNCNTCHTEENNDYSGVPGAPDWALAPKSMTWEGLTRVEIARSMLNRKNNGDKSLDEIVKHLTEHELVLWAWEPGVDAEGVPREKPPVPKEEYIAAVKAWAAAGAIIPEQ